MMSLKLKIPVLTKRIDLDSNRTVWCFVLIIERLSFIEKYGHDRGCDVRQGRPTEETLLLPVSNKRFIYQMKQLLKPSFFKICNVTVLFP